MADCRPGVLRRPRWGIYRALRRRPGGPRNPRRLEAICLKAMALNPEDRYADAMEIKDDIMAFQSGYAAEAERASLWLKLKLFVRRNRYVISIISLLLLLAGTFLLALHYRRLLLLE